MGWSWVEAPPEAHIREATGVVVGMDGRKMSSSYDNGIPIFGSKKQIRKRVMSIVTDPTPLEDPKDPDQCNVFTLFRCFSTEAEQEALAARYRGGNYGYGHAKVELFDKAREYFAPMQEKYDEYKANTSLLEEVLQNGAARARAIAEPVIERVRDAVGLPRGASKR